MASLASSLEGQVMSKVLADVNVGEFVLVLASTGPKSSVATAVVESTDWATMRGFEGGSSCL